MSEVGRVSAVRVCRFYPDRVCPHDSCGYLELVSGNVCLCFRHPNPDGLFTRRRPRLAFLSSFVIGKGRRGK